MAHSTDHREYMRFMVSPKGEGCRWTHQAEVDEGVCESSKWVDCTDMSDEDFEIFMGIN